MKEELVVIWLVFTEQKWSQVLVKCCAHLQDEPRGTRGQQHEAEP